MEYIYLVGTEQVQQAASTMREAANTIHRAASEMSFAMEKHGILMRELIDKLNSKKEGE